MSNKHNFIQDNFPWCHYFGIEIPLSLKKSETRKIQHFSYGYQWIHYVEWYMNSNYLLTKYQNLNLN